MTSDQLFERLESCRNQDETWIPLKSNIENYLRIQKSQSENVDWKSASAHFTTEGIENLFAKATKFNKEALRENKAYLGDDKFN